MMDTLMNCVVCGFELYMLWGLGRTLLPLKEKNIFLSLFGSTLCGIGYVIINSFNSSTLNLIAVPSIYLLFSFWNFGGGILKTVCVPICYYTLVILPEFIFAILINVDSDFSYRINKNSEILTFIILLIMKMITFLLVKCVEQIHKRKHYEEEEDKVFLELLVLPLSTIIFLCGLFYSDISMASVTAKNMVLLGAVLLMVANAFMFHVFNRMLINVNKAQKLERLYLKSNMEKKYLEQLSKADEERRKLLHDVNKYVRAAANCVAMGNLHESKEIFQKLNIKILETRPIEYSKNKILNVILTDRNQTAIEEKIMLEVKVEPEIDFSFMDDIDIIAIFGNLLDNAYQAAINCGKKGFVKVRVFTENHGHFLIINVDNNYTEPPILGNKGYLTRKSNKRDHGIGIHTVEQIVQSYNGRLLINVRAEEKIFTVTIIFQQ